MLAQLPSDSIPGAATVISAAVGGAAATISPDWRVTLVNGLLVLLSATLSVWLRSTRAKHGQSRPRKPKQKKNEKTANSGGSIGSL